MLKQTERSGEVERNFGDDREENERLKEFTVGGSCKLNNAYSLPCKTAHEDICIKPPAF